MSKSSTIRVALAAGLVLAAGGALRAADSPAPGGAPIVAEPVAVLVSDPWAGPYVGSHVGWNFQNIDVTRAAGGSASFDSSGSDSLGGGILAGWMLQSGRLVYGIEGDITILETKGSTTAPFAVSSDLAWSASLRARAGVDMGRFLPFLTAGVSVAEMHLKTIAPSFFGDVQTHWGWTAGLGVDVKVWSPNIIRVEYIYADYGSETYGFAGTTFSSDFDHHTIRGAYIVQLDGNDEIEKPWRSGDGRWAGFYGGLLAGWTGSWADVQGPGPGGPTFSYTLNGGNFGVVAGTAWQWDWFVAGFESDLSLLTTEGTSGASPITSEIIFLNHTRVRVGFDAGMFQPFVAGGLVVSQQEHRRPGFTQVDLTPKWGWSLGAGIEFALDDRVSARVEYLHDDLRDIDVFFADGMRTVDMPTETVRVGVTYRAGP